MAELYTLGTELNANSDYFVFVIPNSRVLEIGSASGYVTDFLTNNFGCQVTCIEKTRKWRRRVEALLKR